MANRQTFTGTVTHAYPDAFMLDGAVKFRYGQYYTGPKAEQGQKVKATGDASRDGDIFWLKDLAFDSGHLTDVSKGSLHERLAESVAQKGDYAGIVQVKEDDLLSQMAQLQAEINELRQLRNTALTAKAQAERERNINWLAAVKAASLVYAGTGTEASNVISYATTLFHSPAPQDLPAGDA